MEADQKKNVRDVVIVYVIALVLLKIFYELRKVWFFGNILWLIVPLVFFLVPYFALRWRGDSFAAYGVSLPEKIKEAFLEARPALRLALLAALITFPPFTFLFWTWSKFIHFGGIMKMTPMAWVSIVIFQFFYVALPEELFYRGYILGKLNKVLPPVLPVLKVRVGFGVPVTAVLFAFGHFLINLSPTRLGVFFPALIFGWMREKTGGILASAIYHALCNVLVLVLEQLFF
ncbi:MAG: type II CAAX endopeptidase family protein [Proteobacteria bacterium]|nr:type II CAAX endopeptidase family protein [Pseudomonadota bacterium]